MSGEFLQEILLLLHCLWKSHSKMEGDSHVSKLLQGFICNVIAVCHVEVYLIHPASKDLVIGIVSIGQHPQIRIQIICRFYLRLYLFYIRIINEYQSLYVTAHISVVSYVLKYALICICRGKYNQRLPYIIPVLEPSLPQLPHDK